MTRRKFIRWLLALAVLAGAGIFGLPRLLRRGGADASAEELRLPRTEPPAAIGRSAPEGGKEPLLSYFILSDLHISLDDPNTVECQIF
ncbi:hypothetical protein [Paenibacillus hamazuiensis]|uniref:hypothetical protein n=1 Tax=Paenibacillus hamazuiensis TaxID=2936508 RepID=UPI0020107200|nr:hypothetical protein [Paenibacillus hamazuiensis]